MNDETDEWLAAGQVAGVFGVTPHTIQRWAMSGYLPATRVGLRGHLRFRRSDVDDLLKRSALYGPPHGREAS